MSGCNADRTECEDALWYEIYLQKCALHCIHCILYKKKKNTQILPLYICDKLWLYEFIIYIK